jgi:hypothetical protein
MPNRKSRAFVAALSVLALVGCLKESPTVTIEDFAVVDSYDTSSRVYGPDTPVAVNASILGGEFSVYWDVDSSESAYYVELSLAAGRSGGAAVPFYDARCGSDPARYDCNRQVSMQCHFGYDVALSCGDIWPVDPFNIPADAAGVLTEIPMQAYLRIKACTPDLDVCTTRYQLVEWQ